MNRAYPREARPVRRGKPVFQDRFMEIAEGIEKLLFRLVVISLVVLLVVQVVMTDDRARSYLNALDRWEGNRVDPDQVASARGPENAQSGQSRSAMAPVQGFTVKVTLLTRPSAPDAWLLVNKSPAANFTSGEATSKVYPGDVIEINGAAYNEPLTFRVTGISDPEKLKEMKLGNEATTRGGLAWLGEVR